MSIPTSIIIIGCGSPNLIPHYKAQTGCPFPIFADPSRKLYKVLGMSWTLDIGPRADYMVDKDSKLVQVLPEMEMPAFDTYLCYPEQLRDSAKLKVFRDFLIAKARTWAF